MGKGRGRDDSEFPVVGSQARRGRDSGVRARARSRDFWLRGALGAQPVEPAALVTSPSLLKVFWVRFKAIQSLLVRAHLREQDDHVPSESILHEQIYVYLRPDLNPTKETLR